MLFVSMPDESVSSIFEPTLTIVPASTLCSMT